MLRIPYPLAIVVLLAALIAGCNMPGSTAENSIETEGTQVARTVAAHLTDLPAVATMTQAPGASSPAASTQPTRTPTAGAPTRPSSTPWPTLTRTSAPTATSTSTVIPTVALEELFSDDFSSETGWYTSEGDDYGFAFTRGSYLIYVNISKANIWSIRDVEYEDVVLETAVSQRAGPPDAYYGLVCRHVDGENYYALFISSDGYYGIGKMEEGKFKFLLEGADQSGIIKRGAEMNTLRADCIGDTLRLHVNGKPMAEIQDDTFDSGVTGLIASTRLETGLEVLFDNYAVYQPLP